jgi:hypothetical protein
MSAQSAGNSTFVRVLYSWFLCKTRSPPPNWESHPLNHQIQTPSSAASSSYLPQPVSHSGTIHVLSSRTPTASMHICNFVAQPEICPQFYLELLSQVTPAPSGPSKSGPSYHE